MQPSQKPFRMRSQAGNSDISSIHGSEQSFHKSQKSLPAKTYGMSQPTWKGQTELSEQRAEMKALQEHLGMLPKRSGFAKVVTKDPAFKAPTGNYVTNFYHFDTTLFDRTRTEKIYIYKVTPVPPIRADASATWAKLIRSINRKLENDIRLITFRGDTLWAEAMVPSKTYSTTLGGPRKRGPPNPQQMQGYQQPQGELYQLTIDCKNELRTEDIFSEENQSVRPLLVQMINNKIKQKLQAANFQELGKGRFYHRANIADLTSNIKTGGLKVLSGFKFTLVCLAPQKLWLQIDKSTRVLRTKNMQEELLALRITPEEKNQIFKGAIVVARYGNYKTYVIESIDYSRDPDSTFEIKRGNQVMQVSYREYYERQYHIKIKGPKQPMIRALVKVDQQIQKGKKLTQKTHAIMLVPELVSLTGLSREQRNDEALMQEVADLSRATPQIRFEDSAKLIKVLEAEKKADKLTIGSSVLITGSILPVPSMTVEGSQESDVNPYSMNAPEMKLPIRVLGNREIVVLYSGRSNKSEVIAFYNLIRESSQTFGIVFPPEPQTIEVPLTADQKQQNYNWGRSTSQYLSQLSLQEKAQLILIFFFNPNEEDIYNTLKEGTIRRFHVKSQAILTSSLSKSQTAMSVAGKIGLQIAAKRGISLWEVKKKHPYWSSKRVAIASLGYSRSLKGSFTVAMVGSTNNIQTEIYNYCQTDLLNRDALPREVLEQFYNHWIWQFFQNERSLPDTLIIYREGLSDSQLRRTLAGELEVIESVVGGYSGKELNNFLPYRPEIVFLTVNKKINSRFYMQRVEQKGEVSEKAYYNPKPGAVIYNELASNDQIDFYLVPQKTETGTASPCQYRLVYYHPQHQPFPYDHSKAEVPLQAIAQMTYEQCYNYYNWTGAVRTPAILQYTRKLSKLAGEHIQRPVNKQEIVAILKERISREHVDKTNDQKTRILKSSLESSCKSILNSYYFL